MLDFILHHLFLILGIYLALLTASFIATRALPKGKIRTMAKGVFMSLWGFIPLIIGKIRAKIESF